MEIDVESGEVLWMMETGFDLSPYLAPATAMSPPKRRGAGSSSLARLTSGVR